MALHLVLRRAATLTAPLLLFTAACGGGDEAVENMIEEAIESESDGDVEVDVDVDEEGGTVKIEGGDEEGSMTIESDDGTVTVETEEGTSVMGDEIPAGFPDDVFPVPSDATDIFGIDQQSADGTSYNLSFRVATDPEEFWNDLRSGMPGSAVVTTESSGSTNGIFAAQMVFESWDGWSGLVTINEVDGNAGVNYLIQPSG